MRQLIDLIEKVQSFIESGGPVLKVIFVVTLVMWAFILERLWYYRAVYPSLEKKTIQAWMARKERKSWYAMQVRQMLITEVLLSTNQSVKTIQTFVALCPLLGLLGTVTGMIEVFNIMALVGGSNARAMASGVSMATIPTMAGMVAALSGMYFAVRFGRLADNKVSLMEDSLVRE